MARPTSSWISAREAAGLLDVKLATLYAYASRGLVQSTAVAGKKERRYLREDVERLKARRATFDTARRPSARGTPVV